MAQTGAKSTPETVEASTTTTTTTVTPAGDLRPIVYERRKRKGKGKKKKYSRGTKATQQFERDAWRGVERLAQAVADGVSEYRDRNDKSGRRKRDGAIKDFPKNAGRGLEEAISTASRVPSDITRRLTSRRLTRLVTTPPFFGPFR
jgi:uncharacterized protein DUF6312